MTRPAGQLSAGLIASLLISTALPAVTQAQPALPAGMSPPMGAPNAPSGVRPGSPGAPRQAFRGEVSRFAPRQMQVWRGGQWRHEHHRGRSGWWWVVDGAWYYYPYPIYPYPTYAAEAFYE